MQIHIPELLIERAIKQKYFNKTEAASYLGISQTTFRKWRKDNPIPFHSVEGQILFNKHDLDDFMDKHKRE